MQELSAVRNDMVVEDPNSERSKEENYLKYCVKVIQNNINEYRAKLKELNAESKILYDNYRSNNPELHNELVIELNMQSQLERSLNKNLLAVKKPYFGRINYKEHSLETAEKQKYFKSSIYIGKNGISKSATDIVVVDWRAPIATVYYDSEIGESSYLSPTGEEININLNLKRTFEIANSKLVDYYDTDVIANDEFLTKYLSKNKEVVLGEIIATIQKEQNEIIRDTPMHSVIVQGVAGSGKTTVAMHRISYILYNYKEKFHQNEFYIIGSNKMLLNYITGVLPNLDVYNINQMTMEELLLSLLGKDLNSKRSKYISNESFSKLRSNQQTVEEISLKRFKGSIDFIKAFVQYLKQFILNQIPIETIIYNNKELYTKEEILGLLSFFQNKPLQEKIDLLNKRLLNKIRLENERANQENEFITLELKKYRYYFGKKNTKFNILEIYINFIYDLIEYRGKYVDNNLNIPEKRVLSLLESNINHNIIDLYDLGMLNFAKKQLICTEAYESVTHIVVDEAQDFGVMLFFILKQLFPACTFTIMGDVTQNIHFDSGMNDWETLKTEVFSPDKDKFYVLAKSYRNTVEISNYASNVLKHCTFKTYDIEPIIRHGKEITVTKLENEEAMVSKTVQIVKQNQKDGYTTIAIICRTVEESLRVQELVNSYLPIEQVDENLEKMTFQNGIMVLPIHMTKGLEFDAVILWNPDEVRYPDDNAHAKLLYVAITRALHEMNIVYLGKLSNLLLA